MKNACEDCENVLLSYHIFNSSCRRKWLSGGGCCTECDSDGHCRGVIVGVTVGGTAGTIVAVIEGAIVGVIWWNKRSGEEGDYKTHMIEFCLYSRFAYSNSAYFKPKSGVSNTL